MSLLTRFINYYIEKKLADCPIEIDKERCRNINSLCEQICVASCPTGALAHHAKTGEIEIDELSCHGCGNCITCCPNGAMSSVTLHDDSLLRNIINNSQQKHTLRFACKRADKRQTEEMLQIPSFEVDCLARLHAGLILAPLVVGASYVWLDVVACKDCPRNINKLLLENIDFNFAEATEWLTMLQVPEASIMRAGLLPKSVYQQTIVAISKSKQYDRRAFFKNIGRDVKGNTFGVLGDVADQVVYDEMKKERSKIKFNKRQNTPPAARELLLSVLKKISKTHKRSSNNNEKQNVIQNVTREFVLLKVADNCRLCTICSKLCPTGAITLEKDIDNQVGRLYYRAAWCINCEKCLNLCPDKAIVFADKVKVADFINRSNFLVKETELLKCDKCRDYYPKLTGVDGKCPICQ